MNILLVSTLYPEPDEQGIVKDTKAVHYFAREWVKMGHRVVVLHPYRNPVTKLSRCFSRRNGTIRRNVIEGVEVLLYELQLFVPHNYVPMAWQQRRAVSAFIDYLRENMQDFSPDAVTVHFPLTNLEMVEKLKEWDKLNMTPFFAVFHGSDVRQLQSGGTDLRTITRLFNKCLFRSSKLRDSAEKCGLIGSPDSIALSGIEESLVMDEWDLKLKLNQREKNVYRVSYVGKLNSQKNVTTIIRAVSLLINRFNVLLDIVGDGPMDGELKNLANELNVAESVNFHGRKSREDSIRVMRDADVFVMVSKNETFGLVYIEAMAQGCIPIGSRNEGIDGVIKHGENGLLVSPDDEKQLAEELVAIFEMDAERRKELAYNSYRTAKTMTSMCMAQKYLNFIRSNDYNENSLE